MKPMTAQWLDKLGTAGMIANELQTADNACQPTQVVDACRFILERWAEPADLVVAKVSSDTEEVTGSNPVSPTTVFPCGSGFSTRSISSVPNVRQIPKSADRLQKARGRTPVTIDLGSKHQIGPSSTPRMVSRSRCRPSPSAPCVF
jgi:hypothetical protein